MDLDFVSIVCENSKTRCTAIRRYKWSRTFSSYQWKRFTIHLTFSFRQLFNFCVKCSGGRSARSSILSSVFPLHWMQKTCKRVGIFTLFTTPAHKSKKNDISITIALCFYGRRWKMELPLLSRDSFFVMLNSATILRTKIVLYSFIWWLFNKIGHHIFDEKTLENILVE